MLLLEWQARSLHAAEQEWLPRHTAENQAIGHRDAARSELTRWETRVKELTQAITEKITFVEDRHNRHIHLPELEAVAIKAVLDGYNAGIAENIGRIRGVSGGVA